LVVEYWRIICPWSELQLEDVVVVVVVWADARLAPVSRADAATIESKDLLMDALLMRCHV